jgi:hypothetical protein
MSQMGLSRRQGGFHLRTFPLHRNYSTTRQFAGQNVIFDPIFLASHTFQKFPRHLKTDLFCPTHLVTHYQVTSASTSWIFIMVSGARKTGVSLKKRVVLGSTYKNPNVSKVTLNTRVAQDRLQLDQAERQKLRLESMLQYNLWKSKLIFASAGCRPNSAA